MKLIKIMHRLTLFLITNISKQAHLSTTNQKTRAKFETTPELGKRQDLNVRLLVEQVPT